MEGVFDEEACKHSVRQSANAAHYDFCCNVSRELAAAGDEVKTALTALIPPSTSGSQKRMPHALNSQEHLSQKLLADYTLDHRLWQSPCT
jgi:hypothetical protein